MKRVKACDCCWIPDEIWIEIFKFLFFPCEERPKLKSSSSLTQIRNTCKHFRSLSKHDWLWSFYLKESFPYIAKLQNIKRQQCKDRENFITFETVWFDTVRSMRFYRDVQGSSIPHKQFLGLNDDRLYVRQILTRFPRLLMNCSDTLKNDKTLVLTALKNWPHALKCASNKLKCDKSFVLHAVGMSEFSLGYASDELKNDEDVVLAAVKKGARGLNYATEALKRDREFVLKAVKVRGSSLEFASQELRENKKIVLAAIENEANRL